MDAEARRAEAEDYLAEHPLLLDYVVWRIAQAVKDETWKAHVPVTGTQHDPARGLIHGYCERCRESWPCRWSPEATDGR